MDVADRLDLALPAGHRMQRIEWQTSAADVIDRETKRFGEAVLGVVVLEVENAHGVVRARHRVDQDAQRLGLAGAGIAGDEKAEIEQPILRVVRVPVNRRLGVGGAEENLKALSFQRTRLMPPEINHCFFRYHGLSRLFGRLDLGRLRRLFDRWGGRCGLCRCGLVARLWRRLDFRRGGADVNRRQKNRAQRRNPV